MSTELVKSGAQAPALLGDQEVFVRRTEEGIMKAVKGNVTLQEGHTYTVGGKTLISAEGLFFANRLAGINLVTPPTVYVDGSEKANPFKIRNERTKATERVFVRKIALGRSLTGNLVAIDQTVEYDPFQYLIEDLQKLSSLKGAVEYSKDISSKKPTQIFFPLIADPSGIDVIGLLVDCSIKEVQQSLAAYQRRIKFAERIATTICERNCLKKHPALGIQTVQKNAQGRFALTIVSWCDEDRQLDRINEVADQVAKGERPKMVEVRREFDAAEQEEAEREFESEIAEEAPIEIASEQAIQVEVKEPESVPVKAKKAGEYLKPKKVNGTEDLLKSIHEAIDIMGPENFDTLLKKKGLQNEKLETMSKEMLEFVLRAMTYFIDTEMK